MEFITGEQFLKEDKEVQEVVDNSIKLCIGDRIYHKLSEKYYIYLGEYNEVFWNVFDLENKCTRVVCKDYFCRCLREGELREFIEDITGYRMLSDYNDHEGYSVWLYCKEGELKNKYRRLGKDLLQAYWEVATKVAKESINKKGR